MKCFPEGIKIYANLFEAIGLMPFCRGLSIANEVASTRSLTYGEVMLMSSA
jgi:hypothetical protein